MHASGSTAPLEGDEWRRLHAEHYAAFAERAGPALVSPDEFEWRPARTRRARQLRAAVTWSLDRVGTPDEQFSLRIIAALAYLVNQDRPSGVGTWAERALDLADTAEPAFPAPILAAAAESARGRGEIGTARALAVDALRDGLPPRSPQTCLAYVVLTVVDANLGNIELAYEEIREGIVAAATAIGEDSFATPVLECVAIIFATYNGDAEKAHARTHGPPWKRRAGSATRVSCPSRSTSRATCSSRKTPPPRRRSTTKPSP